MSARACAGVAGSRPCSRARRTTRSTSRAFVAGVRVRCSRWGLSSIPTPDVPTQCDAERLGREGEAADAAQRPHRPLRDRGQEGGQRRRAELRGAQRAEQEVHVERGPQHAARREVPRVGGHAGLEGLELGDDAALGHPLRQGRDRVGGVDRAGRSRSCSSPASATRAPGAAGRRGRAPRPAARRRARSGRWWSRTRPPRGRRRRRPRRPRRSAPGARWAPRRRRARGGGRSTPRRRGSAPRRRRSPRASPGARARRACAAPCRSGRG